MACAAAPETAEAALTAVLAALCEAPAAVITAPWPDRSPSAVPAQLRLESLDVLAYRRKFLLAHESHAADGAIDFRADETGEQIAVRATRLDDLVGEDLDLLLALVRDLHTL